LVLAKNTLKAKESPGRKPGINACNTAKKRGYLSVAFEHKKENSTVYIDSSPIIYILGMDRLLPMFHRIA
jgi:hypothetical protein